MSSPIDIQRGMGTFGNNKKLYFQMLKQLELGTLMFKIADAVDKRNYKDTFLNVHTIKGNVVCVGGARVYAAANSICNSFHREDFDEMIEQYPNFVEQIIEFQRHSLKVQAQNKQYTEPDQARTTCVGKEFSIACHDDFYYCLKGNQTIEDRIKLSHNQSDVIQGG